VGERRPVVPKTSSLLPMEHFVDGTSADIKSAASNKPTDASPRPATSSSSGVRGHSSRSNEVPHVAGVAMCEYKGTQKLLWVFNDILSASNHVGCSERHILGSMESFKRQNAPWFAAGKYGWREATDEDLTEARGFASPPCQRVMSVDPISGRAVKIYDHVYAAAKDMNCVSDKPDDIRKCLRGDGEIPTAHGYKWAIPTRFDLSPFSLAQNDVVDDDDDDDDDEDENDGDDSGSGKLSTKDNRIIAVQGVNDEAKVRSSQKRPVDMLHSDTLQFIRRFESVSEAARFVKGVPSCIRLCYQGKLKTAYKFKWRRAVSGTVTSVISAAVPLPVEIQIPQRKFVLPRDNQQPNQENPQKYGLRPRRSVPSPQAPQGHPLDKHVPGKVEAAAIVMCDPDTGEELWGFQSVADASRYVGCTEVSLERALANSLSKAGYYSWLPSTENAIRTLNRKRGKPPNLSVVMVDIETKAALKTYPNMFLAAVDVQDTTAHIRECVRGIRRSCGGYAWMTASDNVPVTADGRQHSLNSSHRVSTAPLSGRKHKRDEDGSQKTGIAKRGSVALAAPPPSSGSSSSSSRVSRPRALIEPSLSDGEAMRAHEWSPIVQLLYDALDNTQADAAQYLMTQTSFARHLTRDIAKETVTMVMVHHKDATLVVR
jgi:hypothetical protein